MQFISLHVTSTRRFSRGTGCYRHIKNLYTGKRPLQVLFPSLVSLKFLRNSTEWDSCIRILCTWQMNNVSPEARQTTLPTSVFLGWLTMHKQGLTCPCLFLIKNTTQVCANICGSVLTERESEQLPRVSGAALHIWWDYHAIILPRKEKGKQKVKVYLRSTQEK